ncbi:family 10 glycosylhydrolase [Candidatus Sumerlaeota bacterium]|nr:family 10 glycosylhydrolase [Candidatus Sumerlaeota bacterium]
MKCSVTRLLPFVLAAILAAFPATSAFAQKPSKAAAVKELRGVWITNVDSDILTSREKIAEGMDYLRSIGINIVYPVVYNRGMTLYPSAVMEREFGIKIDPRYEGRDVLREILFEAHRNGIEVVPWFEYGFACSYNQGGGFILEQKPEWAALDQDGRLVKKNGFEWLNAFDPAVQNYISDLVLEVVAKYDVDGVQGDDRMPALPSTAGYDAATIARFRAEKKKEPPASIDDLEWIQWRADILTNFLAELRKKVKAANPQLMFSMAPSPYDWGLKEYLQDTKKWMELGLVDALHPQCYRRAEKDYRSLLDATAAQFSTPVNAKVFPGMLTNIGKDYLISADLLKREIAYNRKMGFAGEVFFFYEGLRKNGNALGDKLRRGPYKRDAEIPFRKGAAWRPRAVIILPTDQGPEGAWQRSGDGQTFALAGKSDGRFTYPLSSVTWERYHIYAKISRDMSEDFPPLYTFVSKMAVAAVTVNRDATPHSVDWYYLGSWVIGPDSDQKLILRRDGDNMDGELVAGPLMLMVDRSK